MHEELNNANKTILVKYRNIFRKVTTVIFFALNYNQECCKFGFNENTFTILEVPQEFEKNVITILDGNFSNWQDVIRTEIK